MADPKVFLLKLNKNLNALREREAKYAGNAPPELLNQIDDHEEAKVLTQQRIDGQISEVEWREALEPLLVTMNDHSEVASVSDLSPRERVLRWARDGRKESLADIQISGENLGGVDLRGANLRRANLKQADLSWADLREADLCLADLQGANFHRASLTDAKLIAAKLNEAKLTWPNLERADLSEADLRGANMEGADLKGAILREANLTRANLREAKLSGVRYTSGTKWPKRFDPIQAGAICED